MCCYSGIEVFGYCFFVSFVSYLLRVETEGHLLNGPGVKVYTEHGNIDQNFARGSSDVWSLHQILSKKLLDEVYAEIGDEHGFYDAVVSEAI